MKAYYGISKSLLMLKKYDASRLQTAKLLQISWFINYPKHELKAYNLLGSLDLSQRLVSIKLLAILL
jgi:hypothetical protein